MHRQVAVDEDGRPIVGGRLFAITGIDMTPQTRTPRPSGGADEVLAVLRVVAFSTTPAGATSTPGATDPATTQPVARTTPRPRRRRPREAAPAPRGGPGPARARAGRLRRRGRRRLRRDPAAGRRARPRWARRRTSPPCRRWPRWARRRRSSARRGRRDADPPGHVRPAARPLRREDRAGGRAGPDRPTVPVVRAGGAHGADGPDGPDRADGPGRRPDRDDVPTTPTAPAPAPP